MSLHTTAPRPMGGVPTQENSVERGAARAGALRVRVVDREALSVDTVDEVDRGAAQVRSAHPVHHDLDAAELVDDVALEVTLVEEELVAQSRTATGLHGDPQPQVIPTLLLQQGLGLLGGGVTERHACRSCLRARHDALPYFGGLSAGPTGPIPLTFPW